MPTSQLAGSRARRGRSVRDVTGREYQRLAAETEAKREAAGIDPAELRKTAYAQGADAGYDMGWTALATALHGLYKAEGISAIEEFLTELDGDDTGAE
jgi:hypothetical protein